MPCARAILIGKGFKTRADGTETAGVRALPLEISTDRVAFAVPFFSNRRAAPRDPHDRKLHAIQLFFFRFVPSASEKRAAVGTQAYSPARW